MQNTSGAHACACEMHVCEASARFRNEQNPGTTCNAAHLLCEQSKHVANQKNIAVEVKIVRARKWQAEIDVLENERL